MFFSIKRSRDSEVLPLSAFRRGDETAYEAIYRRFRKPLTRYVQTMISDEETAQEVTQEVFLKAFRFRESYQDQHAFSTWLWTIARNTVADHFRSAQIAQSYLTSSGDELMVSLEEFPCPQSCAQTRLEKRDDRRTLLKMMKSLTRLQKRVLWMRAVHQLSNQEIAARLGLTLASVKNLGHRAKLTLSRQLDFVHFAQSRLAWVL